MAVKERVAKSSGRDTFGVVCASAKKPYPSRAAARKELKRLKTSYDGDPKRKPVKVYRCRSCGLWHTTSKGRV